MKPTSRCANIRKVLALHDALQHTCWATGRQIQQPHQPLRQTQATGFRSRTLLLLLLPLMVMRLLTAAAAAAAFSA